jgi:hypothetical protein
MTLAAIVDGSTVAVLPVPGTRVVLMGRWTSARYWYKVIYRRF